MIQKASPKQRERFRTYQPSQRSRNKRRKDLINRFLEKESEWSERDINILSTIYLTYSLLELEGIFGLKTKRVVDKLKELAIYKESWDNERIEELEEESKRHSIGELMAVRVASVVEKNPVKRRNTRIDKLYQNGLNLSQIGRIVKLTRERVRQYITRTGQDIIRKRSNKIRRQLEIEIFGNGGTLEKIILKRVSEESFALGKALEYHFSIDQVKRERSTSVKRLIELFERYYELRKRGERVSYWNLGKPIGINGSQVIKILNKVGLESLSGRKGYGITKEVYERAFEADMGVPDVTYFLGINPRGSVGFHFKKIGKRKKFPQQCISGSLNELTYRLASQIYEAQDLGFSSEEIITLLDCHKKTVEYALIRREGMGNKIIEALNTIYPETKHDRPYL